MAKKFFVVFLGILPIQLCFADQTIKLGQIVVTPYKTAVSTSLNPSSTDIVNVDEETSEGIFTLLDSLKDIPGLSYATTGGLGGDTGIFIRGAESSHTQVLLDGIKLYDPIVTSAYFYGYNYMSLDNLEKIEILKGPYSPLYGSGSIVGTINLLTHKGEGKPTFSYSQEFGSYQTYREKLSSQGKLGKLAYSLSTSRADVNGFYSAKYKNGNHEKDPYHNLNSSLRLDYKLTDNVNIGLITDYAYAKYEYDATSWSPPYLPTDDDDNHAYFYQGVGGINLEHQLLDNFYYKIILGWTRTYRKGWESAATNYWYNGKTYQAKWQGDYRVCDFDKIIFGFDYLKERGEGFWSPTYTPKATANTKGYYIENVLTPIDNLFLAVSFRTEDHSQFNKHNTFSVSGSYLIVQTDTKIKSSFGQGFKAPSLYQLYNPSSGNSNLNPEESESYDFGFEQNIGKKFSLGSTYFHTKIKNAIEWVSTGLWVGEYRNIGKSRIYGVESFIKYLINRNTSLTISYTHMDTKKISDGTRLLRRPNNKLTAKFKTVSGKLNISTGLSYVGNRLNTSSSKLKSYILANIALNYEVNNKLNIFLRLENALDENYELIKGYQTPKFSAYTGIKLKF